MYTFLFKQLHISHYNVLSEAFAAYFEQGCLQACKYDQSLPIMETYTLTKGHDILWLPSSEQGEENEELCSS